MLSWVSLRDLRALGPSLIGSLHHSLSDSLSSWYASSRLSHSQFAKRSPVLVLLQYFLTAFSHPEYLARKLSIAKFKNQLWMVVQRSICRLKDIHKIIITGDLCIVRWAQPENDGEGDYVGVVRLVAWWHIYFLAFVPRFLFPFSSFLDFIKSPNSKLFLWGPDRVRRCSA